jgi:transposase-like protein
MFSREFKVEAVMQVMDRGVAAAQAARDLTHASKSRHIRRPSNLHLRLEIRRERRM